MAVMSAEKFVSIAKDIATNYKTLYILGCFGAPMTAKNKKRYTNNCDYNRQAKRTKMIEAASADTFGFDCVCLIKGILWGWSGNVDATYGGATYRSNGVPDVSADQIMKYCSGVSSDFSTIQKGEIVHISGHVGIYVGDNLVVECTPKWKNNVQFSAVKNLGGKSGYNSRQWDTHGKLRYIEYPASADPAPADPKPAPIVVPDKNPTTETGDDYMFEVSTVKKGTKGADTLLCQKLLFADGYKGKDGKELELDGICGTNTVYAINEFQSAMRSKGIEVGTNGKNDSACGKKCWKQLLGV